MSENIAAIILAAGKGIRFQSTTINKVTLPLAGKPIILYSIELFENLGIKNIFVVVGFAKESVMQVLGGYKVTFVEQKEQLGTASALALALSRLSSTITNVLVVNGDDPFHKEKNVKRLISQHKLKGVAVTFTTSKLADPTGMGRIVRDGKGKVTAIVEEKDASAEQKKIKEVNGACYIFSVVFLKKYLLKLRKSPVTGEYYLTNLISMAVANGERVETVSAEGKWKGINSPKDLKEVERMLLSLK